MFMNFLRFIFVSMEVRMSIRFGNFYWSSSGPMDNDVLVDMLVCVLNSDCVVNEQPGGKDHENQAEPKTDIWYFGE